MRSTAAAVRLNADCTRGGNWILDVHLFSPSLLYLHNTLSRSRSTFLFPRQPRNPSCDLQHFYPLSLVLSLVFQPFPKWCLASLTADWSGCQRHPHPLFPHIVFVCFPSFPCCLNCWIPSVVAPDLSDRRLVRVSSAAPIPCPQFLTWSGP